MQLAHEPPAELRECFTSQSFREDVGNLFLRVDVLQFQSFAFDVVTQILEAHVDVLRPPINIRWNLISMFFLSAKIHLRFLLLFVLVLSHEARSTKHEARFGFGFGEIRNSGFDSGGFGFSFSVQPRI